MRSLSGLPKHVLKRGLSYLRISILHRLTISVSFSTCGVNERDWGAPVSDIDLQRLRGGELFAVHKALVLARLGRHPSEVTEGFVTGSGRVGGCSA